MPRSFSKVHINVKLIYFDIKNALIQDLSLNTQKIIFKFPERHNDPCLEPCEGMQGTACLGLKFRLFQVPLNIIKLDTFLNFQKCQIFTGGVLSNDSRQWAERALLAS